VSETASEDALELEQLRREVERLRSVVARLEAEKAALVRAAIDREYERPPHYL
jgi:uncharacterized coiled-coil protein SlyX